MAQKIKPLGDRVLVAALEAETMKGGIIIPDTAKEKPQQGKVIAVGAESVSSRRSKRATRFSMASTAAPRSSTVARTT